MFLFIDNYDDARPSPDNDDAQVHHKAEEREQEKQMGWCSKNVREEFSSQFAKAVQGVN